MDKKVEKKILILICLSIVWFQCCGARAQDFDRAYEVANVISDLLKTAPNRPLYKNSEKRIEFAKDVLWASDKNKVPELLLTVKIYNESSFRMTAISNDGYQTFGLGQMHGVAAKNCDMKTRRGQLDCAAKWLRFCFEKCQAKNKKYGWFGALSAYGTQGYCNYKKATKPKKYFYSIERQLKIWMIYEQQRNAVRNEIIFDMENAADLR